MPESAALCVRCGNCLENCHIYLSTREWKHAPPNRLKILRKKADFVAFECNGCRRCTVFCPFSVEVSAYVSRARREIKNEAKALVELVEIQLEKGRKFDMHKQMYEAAIRFLEKKHNVKIPLNKKAEILFVPLQGEHTIIPAAKLFNLAEEDWALSYFEASNFAFFLGDMELAKKVSERIFREAEELNAEKIIVTECGHAYRVFKMFWREWFGRDFEILSIVEVAADYLEKGIVEVKGSLTEPVTYHDPCQAARNSGLIEEPRRVIESFSEDFREMKPNKERNFCCGGGGGLVAIPEMKDFRMIAGKKKAEQIKETEAKYVLTICENCRTQLKDLREHYNLNYEVSGVVELLSKFI